MELRFKTRGNSSPQGKPKVFFCCVNEDFEKYFQKLSEDVLALQNCSIWYAKDYEIPLSDDDKFNLSTMNLFIVPVTMNLLVRENGCVDSMIQHARNNHIPVLPIMMELGIERLFEKKFGNMQFLMDDPSDVTAIPYKEKLGNFLSEIFWGDALSKKIREAFDAYVFLSYRKKDRQYAQKLMHLIHEKDACRDIAIWYDEFLVPGEDFSKSIIDALEKSHIFAMVVTPNLINEENYILSTEYPMACDRKKPILPVEMEPTDAEKLSALYNGIPNSINNEDKDSIYNWIENIIPDIIATKQNKDARHSFFMGLAYLSGIDVEVDRKRAISLVESAADGGLDEAMEKLVSMYSYGDGISQSYENAMKWQEKLVEKYADISEKTMKEEDIIVFLRHIDEFGNLAYKFREYGGAKEKYEAMYQIGKWMTFGAVGKNIFSKIGNFIKKYSGHSKYYMDSYYYFLKSIRMLLFLNDAVGDGIGRDAMIKRAMVVGNIGMKICDDERIRRECCLLFGKLGELCLDSGNIRGAEHWFQKEKELLGYFETKNSNIHNRMHEVSALCHSADMREQKRNYIGVIHDYEEAIKKLVLSYEEFQNTNFLLKTGVLYRKKGIIYLKLDKREKAKDALDRAKYILDDKRFSDLPSFYTEKALLWMTLGDYYNTEGIDEQAEKCYKESIKILTNEIDEKISADDFRNAAFACMKYGDHLFKLFRLEESMQYYKKSEEYYVNVAMFSKSVDDTRHYISCLTRLFDIAVVTEDFAKAEEWIDKAYTFANVVAESTGLESDIQMKNDILKKKEEVKRKMISSKISGNRNNKDSMTLEEYVDKKIKDIDFTNPDEIQKNLETQIGNLCWDFWKTHPLFKKKNKVVELGESLLEKPYYVENIKDKDLTGKEWYLAGKVSDILLDAMETSLKYDEEAMIILAFCGYYDLKYAKRVKGGKEVALKDYYNFFKNRPFWKYSIDDINYPELWVHLAAWVSEINIE